MPTIGELLEDAARAGDVEALRRLLPGANPNQRDSQGCTLVHIAAYNNRAAAVALLKECGADVNLASTSNGDTPMSSAVREGYIYVIHALGASVDLNQVDSSGCTPIFCAVTHGQADAIRELRTLGADVTSRRGDGRTPLTAAVQLRYADVIRALVEGGADVNELDSKGRTLAYLAVFSLDADMVRALGALGANMNLDTQPGRGGLMHIAAYLGRVDVIDALAAHGADLNAVAEHGGTPTAVADAQRRPAVVQALAD